MELPVTERPVLSRADLAAILGYRDPATFRTVLRDLLDRHQFPPPLPGFRRDRWSRAQVMAWLAGARVPAPADAARSAGITLLDPVQAAPVSTAGRATPLQARLAERHLRLVHSDQGRT